MVRQKINGLLAAAGVSTALTLGGCTTPAPFSQQAQLTSCIQDGILPKDISKYATADKAIASMRPNGEHITPARISKCRDVASSKLYYDSEVRRNADGEAIVIIGIPVAIGIGIALARQPYSYDN